MTEVLKINSPKLIKNYKAMKTGYIGFLEATSEAVSSIFPRKLASILMSEVAVLYYVFWNWSKYKMPGHSFSYHKRAGILTILYVLMGLFAVETFVMHYLLLKWSSTTAWVMTILSVYAMLQILALIKSIPRNPIVIEGRFLLLRYGYLRTARIRLTNIASVVLSKKSITEDEYYRKLSPLADLESHNVLIHLHESAKIEGVYSYRKSCRCIVLNLDEVERFRTELLVILTHRSQ